LRRHERDEGDPVREDETIPIGAVELDALTTLFAPPRWLRDLVGQHGCSSASPRSWR
jgi:hypothetical protein